DAGIDADADGEGEDHDKGEQRVAADDAAAVADVLPEGGEEDGGVAALLLDFLFPGPGQEAAGGDHSGGEHLGFAPRGGAGGEGDGDVLLEGTEVQRLEIGFERFFPEQGVFSPALKAFGAPAAPEKHEAGGECEEK